MLRGRAQDISVDSHQLPSMLPPPRVFFRRHYPLATLRFCGLDPEQRKYVQ